MPDDDKIDQQSMEGILNKALDPKKYRGMRKQADNHADDLNLVHAKALNKILFKRTMEEAIRDQEPSASMYVYAIQQQEEIAVPR